MGVKVGWRAHQRALVQGSFGRPEGGEEAEGGVAEPPGEGDLGGEAGGRVDWCQALRSQVVGYLVACACVGDGDVAVEEEEEVVVVVAAAAVVVVVQWLKRKVGGVGERGCGRGGLVVRNCLG